MNPSFAYPGIEKWTEPAERAEPSAIEALIERIAARLPREPASPPSGADVAALKRSPFYHYKAGCFNDPDVVKALAAKGLHYESREMGGTRWLVVVPEALLSAQSGRVPLVVVLDQADYDDPLWAMDTLKRHRALSDAVAAKQNATILYVVGNHQPIRMISGIITEGIQNYCGLREQILIDVSALNLADEAVAQFNGLDVINFAGRWVTPWRAHPIDAASDGTVDKAWLIHSEVGRKMLLSNRFCAAYKTPDDPEVQRLWAGQGLKYATGTVNGERYVIFTPKARAAKKLPVMVCMHEVNEPNDHGILLGYSLFREYVDIAAQGDCAVILFAMESPRLNDWIVDILQEAQEPFGLDPTRVYLTGHSHNGHFVQEFARRHPRVVAGIAPLGNSPGLPSPEVSHEAVVVDDARAAAMESIDMPTCILCGCKEVGCLVPINQRGHASEAGINVEGYAASAEGKIAMWNRRLKAERCSEQAEADVLAAAHSASKAERMLGFPNDAAHTLYIDGFEHYVADIKNVDGKRHFRVVAIEQMPHTIVPSMHLISWNYLRRFARDPATGEVVELD